MGSELEFRVDQIAEINKCAAHLSDKFDDVIAELVMSREEDGVSPFIILSAIANVLIKVALLTDGKRETVLSILNDFMPSNDELTDIKDKYEYFKLEAELFPVGSHVTIATCLATLTV